MRNTQGDKDWESLVLGYSSQGHAPTGGSVQRMLPADWASMGDRRVLLWQHQGSRVSQRLRESRDDFDGARFEDAGFSVTCHCDWSGAR